MLVERTLEEVKKIYPTNKDHTFCRRCIRLDDYTCSIAITKDIHALIDWELWDKILQHYRWSVRVETYKPSSIQKFIILCTMLCLGVPKIGNSKNPKHILAEQIIFYAIGLPYMFPVYRWKKDTDDIEYKFRTANRMIDNRICNLYVDKYLDLDPLNDNSAIDDNNVVKIRGEEIGQFDTREEAELAHDKAAIDAFGWFAAPYHKDTVIPNAPVFYNPDKLPI